MPTIEWTDALRIGIPQIDSQHQQMVGIVNYLLQALKATGNPKAVRLAMTELREFALRHFQAEEALMESLHFPGLPGHQQEHQAMTAKIKELQRMIYRQENLDPFEVRDFIRHCLVDHFLHMDRLIAQHMHATQQGLER